MLGLPKYFNNLNIAVSVITGKPRIVSIKPDDKSNTTDKYKNIDERTWVNCILLWLQHRTLGCTILDDYTVLIGGKVKDKKDLIKCLENIIDSVKSIKDEN